MNVELEKQFVEMIEVCDELGKQETTYHEHEDKIAELEEKIEQCKLSKTGKIVAGIITFFGMNFVLGFLMPWLFEKIGLNYLYMMGAIVVIGTRFIDKQYQLFKANDKKTYEEEIEYEKSNLAGILTVMKTVIKMNDTAFEGMPEEYIYSIAIEEMHKYVKHGRANTIPEAINLYEEQLHRWKIEEQNGQLLDSQYRQEQRLANIEFYTSLSAFFD